MPEGPVQHLQRDEVPQLSKDIPPCPGHAPEPDHTPSAVEPQVCLQTPQEAWTAAVDAGSRLPSSVSLELGALVEPLSVALHAAERAKLSAGATVLVFGAGTVGLACAAISKVVSASRVVIADIREERVRFAVAHGFADAAIVVPVKRPGTVEARLEFAREVAEMVKSTTYAGSDQLVGEVSATYECTGVEACLQAAIYVSICIGNTYAFPSF